MSTLYTTKENIREVANTISNKAYGYSTGYSDIDKTIFGLHQSELIVIAGRPSMGKTSLMMNIAARSSIQIPQLIFSCEMSSRQLMERMISDVSEIPYNKLRQGQGLTDTETERMKQTLIKLENRPIYIDDRSILTPAEIRQCCELFAQRVGKEFIVYIDYVQLMSADSSRPNRSLEIDAILVQLRAIMKDFNIPIVITSQLNREIERRQNHEPRLSDLRESGGIEQAADIVILLHRPSYYKMKEIDFETEDDGEAYLIIAKNKNGATGKVPMIWIPEFMGFRSIGALDEQDLYCQQQPDLLQEEIDDHMGSLAIEVESAKEDNEEEESDKLRQCNNDYSDTNNEAEEENFWQTPVEEDGVDIPEPEFLNEYTPPDDDIPY